MALASLVFVFLEMGMQCSGVSAFRRDSFLDGRNVEVLLQGQRSLSDKIDDLDLINDLECGSEECAGLFIDWKRKRSYVRSFGASKEVDYPIDFGASYVSLSGGEIFYDSHDSKIIYSKRAAPGSVRRAVVKIVGTVLEIDGVTTSFVVDRLHGFSASDDGQKLAVIFSLRTTGNFALIVIDLRRKTSEKVAEWGAESWLFSKPRWDGAGNVIFSGVDGGIYRASLVDGLHTTRLHWKRGVRFGASVDCEGIVYAVGLEDGQEGIYRISAGDIRRIAVAGGIFADFFTFRGLYMYRYIGFFHHGCI